jgi:CheY-like chemotaxis protein
MATILVVDDHSSNRDFLVTLLGYQGHRLLEAADGAEALALVRTVHPDLIISDIIMPTRDGYEFVRQLRADSTLGHTPVIFSTAHYLDREAEALAQQCGVPYILPKPTEPETVLRVVTAALSPGPEPSPPAQDEAFDRAHLQLLTDQLDRKATDLQRLNDKLRALIELSQHLVSEHNPQQLMEAYCRGAREIIGASLAILGLLNDDGTTLRSCVGSGLDPDIAESFGALKTIQELFGTAIAERRPLRLQNISGEPHLVGLPSQLPLVYAFLGVPIDYGARLYGWLWLANKLGSDEFNQADEHMAITLAAQMAVAQANTYLFHNMQRQAVVLAEEVAERKRAEGEVHSLNANLDRRVRERTAELEVTNQELEAFNASISHDLYAPVALHRRLQRGAPRRVWRSTRQPGPRLSAAGADGRPAHDPAHR